ncbi:lipid-A-disaccharide synthase [Parabacteroides sp. PFB2-12]|uniref:lipid-A-disaccharide synthase n=1 Tax=unclassified Parabacteroides TaxID=2649774 RepID=UPI002473AB00|nr:MULTISPECIES: lipid-A-disaccharide synthase [unclassified Parabacteroides]MDH6343292.1 lipid-A-disaccharide synthase [Parabacteroides sp. PM6-13]MDH6390308.1 lipid-A-disaccharide synthase [Parabacteroides sp. PFB2-12]
MKYYLIAGEASGDLHAANLMAALKETDPEAEFRFFGGDRMQAIGGTLVKHYREMAYMGFIPVLLHARTILNNMRMCREDIAAYRPDVVILIDYPGFNLNIAKHVKKKLHIPVYYYISPKIWAWKKYRIKDIRRYVDRMFCILPFETGFYQSLNYAIDYVGNPSVDEVARYIENESIGKEEFQQEEQLSDKKIIALLAGSRKQEIKDNLPTMLRVTAHYPDYQVVIAGAPGISPDYYRQYMQEFPDARILFGKTYALLQHSCAALVTSGTATLEATLFLLPQVVCYYTPVGNLVSFVFHRFFGVDYISLVNLIANKPVVQELFGKDFKSERIHQELDRLINDTDYRNQMIFNYEEVVRTLGAPGASQRTAQLIYESLKEK